MADDTTDRRAVLATAGTVALLGLGGCYIATRDDEDEAGETDAPNESTDSAPTPTESNESSGDEDTPDGEGNESPDDNSTDENENDTDTEDSAENEDCPE